MAAKRNHLPMISEQTAEQRVIELEELLFKIIQHWDQVSAVISDSLINSAREALGLDYINVAPAPPSKATNHVTNISTTPKILIIYDNDDGEVNWHTEGDVAVTYVDTYPASSNATDSEAANDYSSDYFTQHMGKFTRRSEPWNELRELDRVFQDKRDEYDNEDDE